MRAFAAILCALVLFANHALARSSSRYPALDWGLKVGVTGVYNDNVLRLSETDENAFHAFDPSFRTPLESTDDGEVEYSLTPSVQWRAPRTTMVTLGYRFKAVQRLNNDHTNYQTHGLNAAIRPRVKGYRWVARAGVFVIPSFYLRAYRDKDWGSYEDARFENREFTAEFSYRIAEPLWLSALGGLGTYYYGDKFTEYDSEYRDVGAELEYATLWKSHLSGRYVRRVSDNVGKSQSAGQFVPAETQIEDTEYGDGDFNEDEFRLALKSQVKVFKSETLDLSLAGRMRRRVYTTDRSLADDPYHRGRLDLRWDLTPSIGWSPNSLWDILFYFTYEERATESDYSAVPLVKDFVRREAGLGFTYRIN